MLKLIMLREKMKIFYSKHGIFIMPMIKLFLILTVILLINFNLGYLPLLNNYIYILLISLVSMVLPFSIISVILSIYLILNIYTVSLEIAFLIAIFLLLIALLYYGFKPGDSYLLIITPLFFVFKIQYSLPLIFGLSGNIFSIIPICAGTILYYLLLYIKNNVGILTNDISIDITQRYLQILNAIISNKLMYIIILAFIISFLSVYIVHNLHIDYAWDIAIAIGIVSLLILIFVGEFSINVVFPILELILSLILSTFIVYIYKFFIFNIDYTGTEYLQFEDDEYNYYVKAVPKISIKMPDYKNEKITTIKNKRRKNKNKSEK